MENSQHTGVSTFASRTSPSTDQSFVKELAKPTQDKIIFIKFHDLTEK